MNLYILESYDPSMQFDDSVIVALTPEVCYHLDKKGIDYSIIDDYYDEDKFMEDRWGFLQDQNNWFTDFDNFLKKSVDILNMHDLNLASIYSTYLKTNVVDPLIFKSYMLKSLFDRLKPSSIIYVTSPPKKKVLTDDLMYTDKSVYAYLIPLFCENYSINLIEHFEYSEKNKIDVVQRKGKAYFGIWKYIPAFLKMLCSIFIKKKQKNTLNILQLNFAYNGFEVIKNSFIKGYNTYLLAGNRILKFHRFGFKVFDIRQSDSNAENKFYDWNKTAQLLETNELINWINVKCSLDVSEIVLPNLKHFVSNVCPDLLQYYLKFHNFYDYESIDVVVSPFMQSTTELAAIEAANKCEHTKTICIEHGDDISECLFWRLKELTNFDVIVVSNKESKQYLEYICSIYKLKVKIYIISERLSPLVKIAELRKTGKFNKISEKNEIIYLPTFLTWDALRIDADIHLSPTKYYKFQKALLEYFSEKKDYTFIWKGLFQSEPIYNPIPALIKDEKITNIRIETEQFKKYIPHANKVVCDYPSTGMYESVIAGVPTMCLCSDKFNARKSGIKHFENVIKIHHNVDEAIGYIDEFISSDSEKYTAHLETSDKNLTDIIELECGI